MKYTKIKAGHYSFKFEGKTFELRRFRVGACTWWDVFYNDDYYEGSWDTLAIAKEFISSESFQERVEHSKRYDEGWI